MRVLALVLLGFALASCTSGGTIADMVPHALGGLPKNAPPRPGTPEYDEYKKRLEGQAIAKPDAEQTSSPASAGN